MARRFLPSPPSAVRALVIGDESHVEFGEPVTSLRELASVRCFLNVAGACNWLHESDERPIVDLIVLLQSRPGEFSAEPIAQLQRATPLSRIVVLAGSWCEGEPRSGRPLPGIERVYWYDWRFWQSREIDPKYRGLTCATSGPDETGMFTAVLGINASRFVDFEALAAAGKLCGISSLIWLDPRKLADAGDELSPISILLWDGRYGDADELQELQRVTQRFPGRPVVALFSYPRFELFSRANHLGLSAILAKPLRIDDLRTALTQAAKAVATKSSHRQDVA